MEEEGLLMREAVGWDLVGCRGCFVGCLLPLVITLKTGLLPVEDFHLLLLALLLASGGEGLELKFRSGVCMRWPDWGGVACCGTAAGRLDAV
jgi:hypothetical protein